MRELPVPARITPGQPSLLVIIFMQRMVFVYPPSSLPLASQTVGVPHPRPSLSLVSADRSRCLLAHALTDSLSIGSASQTR